uniref:Protein xylosyltransferase n=1 Tax=Mesocestoides corti TaxID=53468 RepID=A0A5K3G2Q0_MESCO
MLLLFNHYNARYTSVTLTGSSSESAEFFAEVNSPAHPHCLQFRERFAIAVDPHVDMDIAFTLVVHEDVGQIARLLQMIYRQNNYYCIHADRRSDFLFTEALRGVATCFGTNVELVPHEQRVETGVEESRNLEVPGEFGWTGFPTANQHGAGGCTESTQWIQSR